MIETERLILRQWRDEDLPTFAALNADPQVMRFFPKPLTRAESDAGVQRARQHIDEHGWGFFATERKDSGEFIGFVGIKHFDGLPITPEVEIGWRLAAKHWRQGFASEAAAACRDYAFNVLRLPRLVAFTPLTNVPSQGVMRRIGMHDTGNNFTYPDIPAGSSLNPHCLFAIDAPYAAG